MSVYCPLPERLSRAKESLFRNPSTGGRAPNDRAAAQLGIHVFREQFQSGCLLGRIMRGMVPKCQPRQLSSQIAGLCVLSDQERHFWGLCQSN